MPPEDESTIPQTFVPLRVFLSHSDKGDLEDEGKTATKAVKDLYLHPVHPKGASPDDVVTDYLMTLENCDIVVVILGEKDSPNVQNEFNFAIKNGIDCLMFIKDCEKDEELDKKIEKLYSVDVTYCRFDNLGEFEIEIKKSIINLLSRRFKSGKKMENAVTRFVSEVGVLRFAKPIIPGEYLYQGSKRLLLELNYLL